MAEKWQTISELAETTSRQVTQSPEQWRRFLTTAGRFYKAYDFDDQLLIYAQKPDATAAVRPLPWSVKDTAASPILTMCMMWRTPTLSAEGKTRGCGAWTMIPVCRLWNGCGKFLVPRVEMTWVICSWTRRPSPWRIPMAIT